MNYEELKENTADLVTGMWNKVGDAGGKLAGKQKNSLNTIIIGWWLKERSSEFLRNEMKIFHGILGLKRHQRNISVEMCSYEFFFKHALWHCTFNYSAVC